MADGAPQNQVSASLGAIEANIIIAGAEAVTGIWVIWRSRAHQCIFPHIPDTWQSFSVYAVVGLLGIVVAGFALEAVAGLLETAITRRLCCKEKEEFREWYAKCVELQKDGATIVDDAAIVLAQKWRWRSPQAYEEFARRRLRILVARNTAALLFLFTLSWLCWVRWSCWLLLGVVGFLVFFYLWLDAQKGWNRAVRIAGKLGDPCSTCTRLE